MTDVKEKWLETLKDLNVCSQKGLVEMFDGSHRSRFRVYAVRWSVSDDRDTGYGCKVPVMNGTTDAVSMMSYGFDPYLSSWSPYHGAIYAVVESVAKIVAQVEIIARSVLHSKNISVV